MPARFRGEPGKIAVCGVQTVTDHHRREVKLLRRTRGAAGRAAGLMRNRIFECSRIQTESRWASQLLDSSALAGNPAEQRCTSRISPSPSLTLAQDPIAARSHPPAKLPNCCACHLAPLHHAHRPLPDSPQRTCMTIRRRAPVPVPLSAAAASIPALAASTSIPSTRLHTIPAPITSVHC